MIYRPAIGLAAVVAAGSFSGAHAQAPTTDPDWPCVQRLVPALATGQMWRGPQVDAGGDARSDGDLAALSADLSSRSVPVVQVRAKVEGALGATPPDRRPEQLTRIFAATLDRLNAERSRMIDGIKRYARAQRGAAEKITAANVRIDELSGDPAADAEVAELRTEQAWVRRVYDDRQKSLRTLCDQPVMLEQRAFAVARELAELLP